PMNGDSACRHLSLESSKCMTLQMSSTDLTQANVDQSLTQSALACVSWSPGNGASHNRLKYPIVRTSEQPPGGNGPLTQTPPPHWSPMVQIAPSSQATVLFVCVHPVDGLQPSSVQALGSAQLVAVPVMQTADWQASPLVHAFPSVHAVPFAFAGLEHAPVAGLQVPAEWH